MRYNVPGGMVEVATRLAAGQALLVVTNTGPVGGGLAVEIGFPATSCVAGPASPQFVDRDGSRGEPYGRRPRELR